MKTLVVYDNEGIIVYQRSGTYRIPVGLPYLELEVPEGKLVSSIDISETPHQVVFEDLPPNEMQLLNNKITEQEQAITELTKIIATLQGGNA